MSAAIVVFPVGLIVAILLYAIGRAQASEGPPAAPPDVSAALRKLLASCDVPAIRLAAAEARKAGRHELAAQLDARARSCLVAAPLTHFRSPFPNVPDELWNAFVQVMRGPDPRRVTPGGALGLFGFTDRALADLRLMTNLRKESVVGPDGKKRKLWVGDWVPPMTREKFLGDAEVQYQAFVRRISALARAIGSKYSAVIGTSEIADARDGSKTLVTLAGLLAVAHMAGLRGLDEWLRTPELRVKHPSTLDRFKAAAACF